MQFTQPLTFTIVASKSDLRISCIDGSGIRWTILVLGEVPCGIHRKCNLKGGQRLCGVPNCCHKFKLHIIIKIKVLGNVQR